jgi:hypothetical protein
VGEVLALNNAFLVICGVSSSSVSSISTESTLGLFFEGAVVVVVFAFTFSTCVCPFLLISGIVLEGNISATCKVSISPVTKSDEILSHLFITYL